MYGIEIHDFFFFLLLIPTSSSASLALSLSSCQKLQVLAEGAAPAGDLSEEVDEVQSCGGKPPGEEEGYDADSESNPEDMAKQEEGRSTLTATLPHTRMLLFSLTPPQGSIAAAHTKPLQILLLRLVAVHTYESYYFSLPIHFSVYFLNAINHFYFRCLSSLHLVFIGYNNNRLTSLD